MEVNPLRMPLISDSPADSRFYARLGLPMVNALGGSIFGGQPEPMDNVLRAWAALNDTEARTLNEPPDCPERLAARLAFDNEVRKLLKPGTTILIRRYAYL